MDLERVYREERARALATLIRLLGDFDLAEEALQDAFTAAVEQWPRQGWPGNPRAWLIGTARHKGIDRLRRDRRLGERQAEWLSRSGTSVPEPHAGDGYPDDRLRLIFTCCHPALAPEAQVALTLKTLTGLSVQEIARAFLVAPAAMAQRLVRAKAKIRVAGVPYAVPPPESLRERLEGVLRVVYLLFTEGYAPTTGEVRVRSELCAEAIRLGRLLRELLPREAEVAALLGLMLLQDSRRTARFDAAGGLVTLEEQDRRLWDAEAIREGVHLAEAALHQGGAGFYALQAAVAALHGQAVRPEQTDWGQIAVLYALLLRLYPSAVVALNHAAAVGMAEGPERGLLLIDGLAGRPELAGYHLLPAARADLLRRLGRRAEASAAYDDALRLVGNQAERRYLERRRRETAGD